MKHALLIAIPLTLLFAGCGNDSGQQAAAPAPEAAAPAAPAADTTAAPSPAAEQAAPAPQVASETTAAPIGDDTVVYDPIDVSKLQSTWWQQYNAGG